MKALWQAISAEIAAATGEPFVAETQQAVGGGCINSSFRIGRGPRTYFVKLNRASGLAMFEAEARGLEEIGRTGTIRVPQPVAAGIAGDSAFLVLEYIDLGSAPAAAARLGEQIAAMHGVTRGEFGWDLDNTIGSTPQINTPSSDWLEFWRRHRLGFQLSLAAQKGYDGRLQAKGEALLDRLPALFSGYRPRPSLLHGDLWGGNWSSDADGQPVIFDPAVYYGDREADLAMTELFGGFGPDFYRAYEHALPLDPGYKLRKNLYNLYHVLNHLNLFGGGYARQAEAMMDSLLSELSGS